MSTHNDHIQDDREGQDHSSDANTEMQKTVTQAAKNRLIIVILIGLLGAIVGMIGHHFFQSYLNGRPADAQFWTKNASNAFSQVVALFLGLVASAVLTQAVWRALTTDYTQIKVIDILFSLPDPLSILAITRRLTFQSILPLILTLFIHSLILMSAIAPNSLGIDISPWTNTTAIVPVLDFFYRIPNIPPYNGVDEPSLIDKFMLGRLEDYWDPPGECEISCSIQVQYQAPALACRQLSADEIQLGPPNMTESSWYFYLGNYSQVSDNWGSPYPGFWINYVPMYSEVSSNGAVLEINQTAPAGGVQCNFTDGNYQATFGLANGIKSVQTTLISYSSVQGCEWASTQSTSLKCGNYSYNANAMSFQFTQEVTASYSWTDDMGFWAVIWTSSGLFISTYFNFNFTLNITSLTPPPDSQRLFEQLYSNITLAAILSTGQREKGTILASDGRQVWIYTPLTLCVTYGVAFGFILFFTVYGLYLVLNQGIATGNIFLAVLVSTRNKSLDSLRGMDAEALMKEEMRLDASQVWFVFQEPYAVRQRLLQEESGSLVHSPRATNFHDSNIMSPDTTVPQSATAKPNKWTRVIMIAAYLIGVVLSVSHYIFLRYLNKHNVSQYSQFWIKNASNAFAQATALSSGVVASYSLKQAIWLAINTRTPIAAINRLFSLPAPDAYFQLMVSPWRLKLIPTVLIVLTSYALTLISIFAPNALIIDTSSQRSISVTIPTFNYSQPVAYDGSSASLGIPPGDLWSRPAGCGPECKFEFDFEAVGLSCSDFHFNDTITSVLDGSVWSFVMSNSTPIYADDNSWGSNSSGLIFWVKFFPSTVHVQVNNHNHPIVEATGTPAGSLCRYQDATYHASFLFSNNTIIPSINLLRYNNSYSVKCPFGGIIEQSAQCDNYIYWSSSIRALFAQIAFNNNATEVLSLSPGYVWGPTLMLQNIVDFYDDVAGNDTFLLHLKYTNMSEALVDLFSNYTLGLLATVPYIQTVDATTWGETIWKFNVVTLWYTYIPTHVLMLIVLLYGFYCMHKNGVLDQEFSTLMRATWNAGFGDLVDHAASYNALMKVKLRHEQGGQLVVDNDDNDGQPMEKL